MERGLDYNPVEKGVQGSSEPETTHLSGYQSWRPEKGQTVAKADAALYVEPTSECASRHASESREGYARGR
jgi:hypothetical protein